MMTYGLRSIRFTVCFAAAALLLCAANASAQTTLRWKFKTGQVFDQTIGQEIKLSVPVGNSAVDLVVNRTLDTKFIVANVDAQGTAEVALEFKRIRVKLSGMMNGEADSDATDAPEGPTATLYTALKSMAKIKFQMKMSSLGEITNVELSKESSDALKTLPNAGKLNNVISKDALAEMVQQGAHTIPKEPVKSGFSWTSNAEVPLSTLGKMVSLTKLTYVGPEKIGDKQLERIDVETTAKFEKAAAKPAEKAPAQAAPDVTIADQKSQGKLYFDNVAGHIDQFELVQELTMNIATATRKSSQKTLTTTKLVFKPATAAKK